MTVSTNITGPGFYQGFLKHLQEADGGPFFYDEHSLKLFWKSVTESSFTVVAGRRGTGKTTLSEQFIAYTNTLKSKDLVNSNDSVMETQFESGSSHHKIPQFVRSRRDWKESKDLIGCYNKPNNEYSATPFINALLSALIKRETEHFFLIDPIDLGNVSGFLADIIASISTVRPSLFTITLVVFLLILLSPRSGILSVIMIVRGASFL